jgi:hypothetical protein
MVDLAPPPLFWCAETDGCALISDLAPAKPAIIRRAPSAERQFGLSYAVSRVRYDRFALPRDARDATLAELIPYLPAELRHMPPWALATFMVTQLVGFGAGGAGGPKTVTFLTTTSASNQTWSVPIDWNSSDNRIELISAGGNGGNGGLGSRGGVCPPEDTCGGAGGGGGGGGYAGKDNIALTPSGSMTFRLRAGGAQDSCFANGTLLSNASVGIADGSNGQGGTNASGGNNGGNGNGGAGAATSGAQGTLIRPGGAGAEGTWAGGGGAAGPNGNGGNASSSSTTGGTGDGGNTAAGAHGTQFTAIPGGQQKGSGGGADGNDPVTGGNHGGGGSGGGGGCGDGQSGENGGAGGPALIVITNNRSGTP